MTKFRPLFALVSTFALAATALTVTTGPAQAGGVTPPDTIVLGGTPDSTADTPLELSDFPTGEVTITKLGTLKVAKGKKVTVKPKAKANGSAKIVSTRLTVKKGTKVIARNVKKIKLKAGKYKITTTVKYYLRMTVEAPAASSIPAGTRVYATCTWSSIVTKYSYGTPSGSTAYDVACQGEDFDRVEIGAMDKTADNQFSGSGYTIDVSAGGIQTFSGMLTAPITLTKQGAGDPVPTTVKSAVQTKTKTQKLKVTVKK